MYINTSQKESLTSLGDDDLNADNSILMNNDVIYIDLQKSVLASQRLTPDLLQKTKN